MFNNNKSKNGDEKTAWTFKKAFCNRNNIEEDIGC